MAAQAVIGHVGNGGLGHRTGRRPGDPGRQHHHGHQQGQQLNRLPRHPAGCQHPGQRAERRHPGEPDDGPPGDDPTQPPAGGTQQLLGRHRSLTVGAVTERRAINNDPNVITAHHTSDHTSRGAGEPAGVHRSHGAHPRKERHR